jgi:AcrR family transcriptional regulator
MRNSIVATAVTLAGERGWQAVTMTELAERAGVPLDEVYRHFPTRTAVLTGFGRMVDETVLAGGPADMSESPRDRLFDVLMRRFDVLAEHRAGVVAMLQGLRADPVGVLAELPQFKLSMAWMLETAGIATHGLLGPLKVRALGLIYLLVLREWMVDESPDMSHTMKALDTRLHQADQLVNTIERGPRFGPFGGRPAGEAGEAWGEGQNGTGPEPPPL